MYPIVGFGLILIIQGLGRRVYFELTSSKFLDLGSLGTLSNGKFIWGKYMILGHLGPYGQNSNLDSMSTGYLEKRTAKDITWF